MHKRPEPRGCKVPKELKKARSAVTPALQQFVYLMLQGVDPRLQSFQPLLGIEDELIGHRLRGRGGVRGGRLRSDHCCRGRLKCSGYRCWFNHPTMSPITRPSGSSLPAQRLTFGIEHPWVIGQPRAGRNRQPWRRRRTSSRSRARTGPGPSRRASALPGYLTSP
jgi:hypothetical protein